MEDDKSERFNSVNKEQDYLGKLKIRLQQLEESISFGKDNVDYITARHNLHTDLIKEIKNNLELYLNSLNKAGEIPPELEILDKLVKESPWLFVQDTENGIKFSLTGMPLVKEDYTIIRKFMDSASADFEDNAVKFYGVCKEGDGSFKFEYIFNPKGIPEKALQNLPQPKS